MVLEWWTWLASNTAWPCLATVAYYVAFSSPGRARWKRQQPNASHHKVHQSRGETAARKYQECPGHSTTIGTTKTEPKICNHQDFGSAIVLPFCWDLHCSKSNTRTRERERERERESERERERERDMSIENAGMLEGLNWSDNSTGSGLLIFCASTATQQKCWQHFQQETATQAVAPLNVSVVPRPNFWRLGEGFGTSELSKNQSHYRAARCRQGLFVILTNLDIESEQRRQGRCMLMIRCSMYWGFGHEAERCLTPTSCYCSA